MHPTVQPRQFTGSEEQWNGKPRSGLNPRISAEVPARRPDRVYELTKLDNETFAKALEDGAIHAEMERREALGAGERRQQIEIPAPKTGVTEFRQM